MIEVSKSKRYGNQLMSIDINWESHPIVPADLIERLTQNLLEFLQLNNFLKNENEIFKLCTFH